jgi:group I intron endonuclease
MPLNWIPLADSKSLPAVCGLYLIRGPAGEYVGKSINIQARMRGHRQAKQESGHLHRAIRKHGIAKFEVCVLMTGTEAETLAAEIVEIAARGTYGDGGYNATLGGEGSSGTVWTLMMKVRKGNQSRANWTDEQRAALSARRTGQKHSEETKQKMREARLANNPMKGRKHSPETLAKQSAATTAIGRKISPEQRLAMAAGKVGKKNRPQTELTKLRLSLVKTGVPKPAGYADKYSKGERNPMYGRTGAKNPLSKPLGVWTPGSMTPITFESATEACAWAGCTNGTMTGYLQGKYKPKSGNTFAYL